LAILRGSFRSLARTVLPLAPLFILSACGGSTASEPVSTRLVHGPGFTFAAPSAWTAARKEGAASARRGDDLVSATVFTLLKTYKPSLFDAAAKELDGVAERLAAQAGETLSERATTTVAGRRIRAYRFGSTRIGFLLEGKREYQLLCKLPPDGSDTDKACELLFKTFDLT
jgi:hypothetical protein